MALNQLVIAQSFYTNYTVTRFYKQSEGKVPSGPSEVHNRGESPGLSSKRHLLELSLSLYLMLVLSGNHLHCINLNVGGERSSGAKCCLSEQKSMMALMLESTPIDLWSKSFTARPFLTCPLEKN